MAVITPTTFNPLNDFVRVRLGEGVPIVDADGWHGAKHGHLHRQTVTRTPMASTVYPDATTAALLGLAVGTPCHWLARGERPSGVQPAHDDSDP